MEAYNKPCLFPREDPAHSLQIRYHAMRKELWDHQEANTASHYKERYGEKLFPHPKKGILERDQHFFALVLPQMNLGNVEVRKM